ncbi:MAG TPA: hydrogen gas-evolving membrane-bound hydrogenase subunit E [Anaerolineae bacterium]|nr:hydrogen gas-evolving membrane-bound hydrogenase subunit E [Anaerolineae bacterium]
MILLIILALSFSAAFIAPPVTNYTGYKRAGWLLSLIPFTLFALLVAQIPHLQSDHALTYTLPWVPSLNINLALRLDGLSLLLALLVTGIGGFIILYAAGYLDDHPQLDRLYFYLFLFMFAMLGVVLADNLLLIFIFWELTSITSYLLIGFNHGSASSRFAAKQALLITGAGGLALMAGLLLLIQITGVHTVTALIDQADAIQQHQLYPAILVLILLGAFTKSAQFPFHFWLPGAMAAPTPVSAYLHSATMVKAGVYLLARLFPVLGGTPLWFGLVVPVGVITAVLGGYVAWRETDLKRILAYATIGVLGILVTLLGLGTDHAIEAAMLFLLAHALYKGALFMVAGAIDHTMHTRDINKLSGLRAIMPQTAVATALAAISMAGLPPFIGFIGKELLYEATQEVPYGTLITTALIIANGLMLTAALLIAYRPFAGTFNPKPNQHPHEPSLALRLGPLTLATLGLIGGLLPTLFAEPLINLAIPPITQHESHLHLALWHGFNLTLLLSLITISFGFAVYIAYQHLQPRLVNLPPAKWSFTQLFKYSLQQFERLATFITTTLQPGQLNFYVTIIIITTIGLIAIVFIRTPSLLQFDIDQMSLSSIRVEEVLILILINISALMVTFTRRLKLVAIINALGSVGFGIALLYVTYSAPDLALTQIAIETLTVVLFMLVIYRLPAFANYTATRRRLSDGIIAVIGGAFMGLITLIATTATPVDSISYFFFIEENLERAHGHNIVNVILADFRGFDTMGETIVLAVAAAGVIALMRMQRDTE